MVLIIFVAAATAYVNVSATQKKLDLGKEVYEEGRFLTERIVKEIRQGTIDYEEYWNQKVESEKSGVIQEYGDNYGNYSKSMIEPGMDLKYGTQCIDINTGAPDPMGTPPPCPKGYKIDTNSIDQKTGVNPFENINSPEQANAVCQESGAGDCENSNWHVQDELYLINSNGDQKTIFKLIANEIDDDFDGSVDEDPRDGLDNDSDGRIDEDSGQELLGILKLTGQDEKTSIGQAGTDGIIDTWQLADDFRDKNDNGSNRDDFVSITSPLLEITNLKFIISPLEDPRKAFNENSESVQNQPHVTVLITIKAAHSELIGIRGPAPEISLQTTVSSRILNEITSF